LEKYCTTEIESYPGIRHKHLDKEPQTVRVTVNRTLSPV
jgi:hypothetical protein